MRRWMSGGALLVVACAHREAAPNVDVVVAPVGSGSAIETTSEPPATTATPKRVVPQGLNVARLKQCCAALSVETRALGSTPEAAMYTTATFQCSALAAQVPEGESAPELGVLSQLLGGLVLPPVCAGF